MGALELRNELVKILSLSDKIQGIGQTGNLDTVLIPGKSDIDLFVLCTEIPTVEERTMFYKGISNITFDLQMSVCNGGQWGFGDILAADGIDVMPMYFTIEEMNDYLEEVLEGKHLEKEGRFYPVGRVSSISTINILSEKNNTWTNLKDMVNQDNHMFFKKWYENEMWQVIDEEDLGRSELRRDILFYHQVLENALDHLLQAIYAVNKCYFPSRKRTKSAIESFNSVPKDCYERLVRIVQMGAKEDTIIESIRELRKIALEVRTIGESIFA